MTQQLLLLPEQLSQATFDKLAQRGVILLPSP